MSTSPKVSAALLSRLGHHTPGLGPWRCSGRSNRQLIDNLAQSSIVRSEPVYDAMIAVDRRDYVPSTQQRAAYDDCPLPIGHGATISAPHMHAQVLEELLPVLRRPGARLLDVGSGTGILLAYAASIMAPGGGRVYGVEHIPELVASAAANLAKSTATAQLVAAGAIVNTVGDGFHGDAQHGPFDGIHVGAAAPAVPKALLEQLAPGGRLVIPVGAASSPQQLMAYIKHADGASVSSEVLADVA